MSVTLEASGFIDFSQYLKTFGDQVPEAARLAINQTAERRAIPDARDEMLTQVNFPSGYLNKDRLSVTKKATNADLEAVISGRDRPTSLARFVVGSTLPGRQKNGVRVIVSPGETRVMKTAFTVRLNSGNTGLVLRVKEGEGVKGKRDQARPFGKNLYLLYGPSVNQVFTNVAENVLNQVGDYLADEFLRQLGRLTGDK